MLTQSHSAHCRVAPSATASWPTTTETHGIAPMLQGDHAALFVLALGMP